MFIDFLKDVFEENRESIALVWKGKQYSYSWFLDRIGHWQDEIGHRRFDQGQVVALEADYSPNSTALLLALVNAGDIVVPLADSSRSRRAELTDLAQAEVSITVDDDDEVEIAAVGRQASHEIYETLRSLGHPGLVLFSSGSTGKSKAAVHDVQRLLTKYETRRKDLSTLAFLVFDHIGGIDTLLYALSNGSSLVTVGDRSPDAVCAAVEEFGVEVLPVTPTFLNLLFLSKAHARYDLSSLKYVTYGTEVMPEGTLRRCAEVFEGVTVLQKYGTTEVGTLRSRSRSDDSPWVQIGGKEFETRIVDGILHVKAQSAMLGYLNAPSPFTEDGWFNTGDLVEVDGDFIRFLGRESEVINVGGEKVNPSEVEGVIEEMDGVAEATVFGESNPLVGNIVCAKVTQTTDRDAASLTREIRRHCADRLPRFKIPVKIEVDDTGQHSARFKKIRVST